MAMWLSPLAAELLAGCLGGTAKTLAFYPLDTITTLREIGIKKLPRQPIARYYTGSGIAVLGVLPYAILFHTTFWLCDSMMTGMPAYMRQLFAATCASFAAAIVGVPFECIKHRVQLNVPGFETPSRALSATLRREGMRGLYTGMQSTIARNIPYNALHFGSFRLFVDGLTSWRLTSSRLTHALAGALAGAVTALLTTPIDLINTRLQTQAMSSEVLAYTSASAHKHAHNNQQHM